jgi:hypothetical protein
MTPSLLVKMILVLGYAAATFLLYVTSRRYPVQSPVAMVQWAILYVATVVYPMGWTVQHIRTLRRLGLSDSPDLHRLAWSPVIVGGTSLLISLSLLWRVLR